MHFWFAVKALKAFDQALSAERVIMNNNCRGSVWRKLLEKKIPGSPGWGGIGRKAHKQVYWRKSRPCG